MSWLLIDTSDRMKTRFAVIPTLGEIRERTVEGARRNAVALLSAFIDQKRIRSMSGICVVRGPGSFSAVRSGVLVANILSRVYHMPLYGVSVDEGKDLNVLRDRLNRGDVPAETYVAPVYDAEPNITCPHSRT
jgi:hypothetical protein